MQQILDKCVDYIGKPPFGEQAAQIRQLAYAAFGIFIDLPQAAVYSRVYDGPCDQVGLDMRFSGHGNSS